MSLLLGSVASTAVAGDLLSWFVSPEARLHRVEHQRLVFFSDRVLTDSTGLSGELCTLEERLTKRLGVPPIDGKVHVYLLQSRSRYRRLADELVPGTGSQANRRRGMYLQKDEVCSILIPQEDREHWRETLHHEFVHAVLNHSHHRLPLWLDEGLACCFQNPTGEPSHSDYRQWLRRMYRAGWQPDLKRLESLAHLSQMGRIQYAEAWSLVHLLLQGPEELTTVLRGYLADRRREEVDEPFSARLGPQAANLAVLWSAHFVPEDDKSNETQRDTTSLQFAVHTETNSTANRTGGQEDDSPDRATSASPADAPSESTAGEAAFRLVAILDTEKHDHIDFRNTVQPGDLLVGFVPPRQALTTDWFYLALPHGHAMIVVAPDHPTGIADCIFSGARLTSYDTVKSYARCSVWRLTNRQRLNLKRLCEFAAQAAQRTTSYSYAAWLGSNRNAQPERPEDIARAYSCSTYVAAAYYYAGLTLNLTAEQGRVITPLRLTRSHGTFNELSLAEK